MKFDKDGKFIKTGEGDRPWWNSTLRIRWPSIRRDAQAVADRGNNRIEIFDQEGKLLDQWKQFSRPTGVFIDRHDTLYVADDLRRRSRLEAWHPNRQREDRRSEIFHSVRGTRSQTRQQRPPAEGVAADAHGNVYGAEVAIRTLKMYVKK